jgi:phosphate/sulfate permease
METVFVILVGLLLILAVSDLIVGVSNDAINFLNSAIGSKSSPYWVIMIIASIGVLFGATFSSGMMEVARNGIFHPQMFTFNEVLTIFLAVMLTDIILLDTFNTLGLPTSTTVSLIFEIMGGAVAVALIQISNGNPDGNSVVDYINAGNALTIVSSILLSIVFAFIFGITIQWIVRAVFSFNFEKNLKYFGGIFGALAITSIIYFMLIKGLNGSIYADKIFGQITFGDWLNFLSNSGYDQFISLTKSLQSLNISPELNEWGTKLSTLDNDSFKTGLLEFRNWAAGNMDYAIPIPLKLNQWVNYYALTIILFSILGFTVLFQSLYMLFRFNILKMVVLAGTFALAMAFAGNDLVNFIGAPLAGLKAYEIWSASGAAPESLTMDALSGKIQTPSIYLLIAGLVMVITLWLSKKARSVSATTINLSKQDEGTEQFSSTQFSRFIVRQSIRFSKAIQFITPPKLQSAIIKRFEPRETALENNASFDMLRAAVNLTVSAILISIGTAWKLPLSTTYVTFMVAMATALADGAWGRDSAVYRVSGVTTVVGGWFVTALIAFTISFLVALLLSYTNYIAVPFLLAIGIFLLIRSQISHRKRMAVDDEILSYTKKVKEEIDILERCTVNVTNTITKVSEIISNTIASIENEDRKKLKKQVKEIEKLNSTTKSLKDGVDTIIFELKEDSIESGHYYVQVLDYLREISKSLNFIIKPTFEHFNNQHSGFIKDQHKELNDFNKEIQNLLKSILNIITKNNFNNIDEPIKFQQKTLDLITKNRKAQIKRIKNSEVGTKNSILYLNILSEAKNLVLFTLNLLKSQRDFIIFRNS